MKKVLGIVGSPRKDGNTHILVSTILAGAESRGATVESILLGSLSIRECDGCHACWSGQQCSKKDDMNNIYHHINSTDILVLGTPVYWYGPTALMKGFIDRFVYYNCEHNRANVRDKLAVLAVPFEEDTAETVAPVVQFFEKSLRYLEMNVAGKIIAGGMCKKGQVLERTDLLESAFKLGKDLAEEK